MKNSEQSIISLEVVDSKLVAEDDRAFWHAALSVLTEEFLMRYAAESTNKDWAIVFRCMFPLGETTPNSLDRCRWLRIPQRIQDYPTVRV